MKKIIIAGLMDKYELYLERQKNILHDLGKLISNESMILDFGCGDGSLVDLYRKSGYLAFGCDIKFDENNDYRKKLIQENIIRKIDINKYVIPFDSNFFDVVVSHEVFEHVQDYDTALSEIHRVLKPGGICLNKFPSKWRIIEPHIFVPFASVIKNYHWYLFWMFLGFRERGENKLPLKQFAKTQFDYMINCTNYLSKKQIQSNVSKYFDPVIFCERLYLKHTPALKFLFYGSFVFPIIPKLISSFFARIIAFKK